MKLFIVLYLAGKIIAVSDPVDWPEDECRWVVAKRLKHIDFSAIVRHGYVIADVRADCEWHNEKPAVDEDPPQTVPPPDLFLIGKEE